MWQKENGPYMQAMYFTFGLGSLLAPLISMCFVGSAADSGGALNRSRALEAIGGQTGAHHHNIVLPSKLLTPLTKRFNGSVVITANDNTTSGINGSAIYIPYSITGALLLTSALIIIIMYIIKKYEPILDSGIVWLEKKIFITRELFCPTIRDITRHYQWITSASTVPYLSLGCPLPVPPVLITLTNDRNLNLIFCRKSFYSGFWLKLNFILQINFNWILLSDDESCDQSSRKSSFGETSAEANDTSELLNNNCEKGKHWRPDKEVSKRYLISMVAVGGVMLCFYEGMENINFEYQFTFFDSTKLDLSEETSDLIVSALSAAYTVSSRLKPRWHAINRLRWVWRTDWSRSRHICGHQSQTQVFPVLRSHTDINRECDSLFLCQHFCSDVSRRNSSARSGVFHVLSVHILLPGRAHPSDERHLRCANGLVRLHRHRRPHPCRPIHQRQSVYIAIRQHRKHCLSYDSIHGHRNHHFR